MIELTPVQRVGTPSAAEFQRQYKRPARPVVLEDATRDWPARRKWTVEYLSERFGDTVVPLYDSKPSKGREHQHAASTRMPLRQYLDLLAAGENDLRIFFFNILAEVPELTRDFSYPDLDLKWFRKLPVLFMGGRGARVQLHFDIDLADILLCHFGGPKRVVLFAPDQTPFLYHVPYSFSALFDASIDPPDYQRFPALARARGQVAELRHGDALYIPPGWWHYVVYEEIGFSMSLRAFPRDPANLARMLRNIFITRSVEALMRRLGGRRWSERNERLAVSRTHRRLGLGEPETVS